MKLELREPATQATIDYFVAMAKGQTAPLAKTKQNGMGIAKQPTPYHVIQYVTPTTRAIAQAEAKTEQSEVIRRPANKKRRVEYSFPGLD